MQTTIYIGATIRLGDGTEAIFVGGVMTNDEKTLILVEGSNRRRQWVRLSTSLEVVDPGSIESASADRTLGDKIKSASLRKMMGR